MFSCEACYKKREGALFVACDELEEHINYSFVASERCSR